MKACSSTLRAGPRRTFAVPRGPSLQVVCALVAALCIGACSRPSQAPAAGPVGDAAAVNAAVAKARDWSDPGALADARRGLVAAPDGEVRDAAGRVLWDHAGFAFVDGDAPPTVSPSLWRQARLNNQAGLFKVADRIWQLRGFDLANLTLIEGATGWIVVDALTSKETAEAAMAFARRHLGDRPVSALIFTHSHVDHFGGALGVLSPQDAAARRVPIVAPAGFVEEATSENLLMGVAMARRSQYMYGSRLPRSPQGLVDNGLGKAVPYGRVGLLAPTVVVDAPGRELTIDGLRFVFHDVGGTEAPSEFVFAIPELGAFCGAELFAHTLHNLYTLRGAKVRDALKWAGAMDAALDWSKGATVLFNQHNWPVWGEASVREFIELQRDAYRYLHDQTVRLMNAGLGPQEIAESIRMPTRIHEHLSVRGYYGTVRHNVKGIYQHYLGWYDAHPSNLDPLPPAEAARRYVELAGGIDRLLESASRAASSGDHRWAAELLRHAVLAQPGSAAAREALARSFEQLGWAAESAPWRNVYLTGALELRQGPPERGVPRDAVLDMLAHAPTERFLEAMAASLNGPAAEDATLAINLSFSDSGENWVLRLGNGVLHYRAALRDPSASATLLLTRPFFLRMMTGAAGAKELLLSDETRIEGSRIDLARFFSLFDKAEGRFPIVTR
jgi:alkyl sulfatase BDS1-like metallo-beta-lactamase superfamily hydrolase